MNAPPGFDTNTTLRGLRCGLATMAAGLTAAQVLAASTAGLEIRVATERQELSLNEPVVVRLHFGNSTSEGMPFDLGVGDEYVGFSVRSPDGKEAKLRFWDLRHGCVDDCDFDNTRFALDPGEEHSFQFVLSEWHSFDLLGEYEIVFVLLRGAVVDIWDPTLGNARVVDGVVVLQITEEYAAWLGEEIARSAAITVRVGPRDADALRERADELLGVVMSRQEWWAAKALRRMVDPVAVPAWERMAPVNERSLRAALDGLVDLGTPAAVAALGRMMGTAGAQGDWEIQYALWRIVDRGRGEESRALARAALEKHKEAFAEARAKLGI